MQVAQVTFEQANLRAQVDSEMGDDFPTMSLPLGLARVDVGYEVCAGRVFVQGVALGGEWVDVDNFADDVRDGWTRAIEKAVLE